MWRHVHYRRWQYTTAVATDHRRWRGCHGHRRSTNLSMFQYPFLSLPQCLVRVQTGEYATDEEEEVSPMFPNAIEVFDLAETEDTLSPVEMDPEKLAHKFKEVSGTKLTTHKHITITHVQMLALLALICRMKLPGNALIINQ